MSNSVSALQAAFPHCSQKQIQEALRKSGEDPNRAFALLLGASMKHSSSNQNGDSAQSRVGLLANLESRLKSTVERGQAVLKKLMDCGSVGGQQVLLPQQQVVTGIPLQHDLKQNALGQPTVTGIPMSAQQTIPASLDAARLAPPSSLGGSPPKLTGRQRAVLIGVNYFNTRAQLRGCINDVKNMQNLLTNTFGWRNSSIRVLTDDNPNRMPTRENIVAALQWLVHDVRPGDVLFLHFSGHGAQKEDPHGYEMDGMNETILPVDFQCAGMLTDDEISTILVKQLPEGVRLTAVMDCCHSGTGLDLPYTWKGQWVEEVNPYHSLGDVQLFSGCEDHDTSADVSGIYSRPGGAMTTAFCDALRSNPCPAYGELMTQLHHLMRRRGFSQRPQLTSTQCFDFNRPFLLDDIVPNTNCTVGRTFRRRFPPQHRRMSGPLADMLGIGVGIMGGMILADVATDVIGGGLLDGGLLDFF